MTMPDETRVWAVPIGTSSSYKSDTRVRNMKLNERLLCRKSKDRKLMLPCDSPFQKRTLTKFPMEHNRSESKQKAESQHLVRKFTEDKVRKAKQDSESMRQYGLKMFDNAVEMYTNDHSRVKSDIPSRLMSAHNGPTHDGSVLYNKRSSVLNSIRLRPKSEPPTRFNHLKSETVQPQIKQTLCRSNMNYTVSCVTQTKAQPARSISTMSYRSDLRLIPNGSLSSDDEFGRSELNDSVFEENENTCSSNASSSVPMDPCFLKRNLPSAEIHFYSIEEDSCSEDSVNLSKTPEVPQPEEAKKDQLPEPQPEPSRPKSGKGRPKSGRSKGSGRSASPKSPKSKTKRGKSPRGKKGKEKEQKPVTPPPQPEVKVIETPPPPKPLKGPKCWVDDATITSEKDILNDEENICNISQTSKPGSPTGKTQTKHQVKIEIGETENIQTLPEPVKKMDTLVLEEVELVTTNGLPPYICPSSEERSRQEAIKDWLAKCSFDSANRCVPMF